MSIKHSLTNIDRATAAWGSDMPGWVKLLAGACDATNQRATADKLDKSSGYVSRLLNCSYTGSYEEAERLVRAKYGDEDVVCPIWGPIPLASCMTNRRRKTPPVNQFERQFAKRCPTCSNNSDVGEAA